MTWTAQQRYRARVDAMVEPFRQATIDRRLRNCYEKGIPCIVRARVMGASGLITELGEGHVVIDWSTNIPRKFIREVVVAGGGRVAPHDPYDEATGMLPGDIPDHREDA